MNMTFGDHKGRSVEWIVLLNPDYALWVARTIDPRKYSEVNVIRELITAFDNKPLNQTCSQFNCTRRAQGVFVYSTTLQLHFSCRKCGKLMQASGMFKQIKSYRHAFDCAKAKHRFKKDKIRNFIGRIAKAKGLPKRGSVDDLYQFFGTGKEAEDSSYDTVANPIPKHKRIVNTGWKTVSSAQRSNPQK